MADRDIVVDVTIRSDTKGAKEGAAALGDVDRAAGGAGKSMHGMEIDAKSLDAQIAKSKETVKGLEAELSRVGNNPGLRKALRVERSWLTELEKIGKSLPDVKLPSPSFDFGPLKDALMPALIGLGVVASPFIGAAVAGAVVGGVGLGGIAGGVIAAAHDDRVKAAWKDFTGTLTKESFGSTAFVQPVIEGITILKAGLADLHIADILGKGADAVPKLASGLIAFARGVMPGVSAALDHADEIAGIFAEGLGGIGVEVGKLIKDFSESKGSMEGLRTVFMATADAISFVNTTVTFLSNTFTGLNFVAGGLAFTMSKLYFWLPPVRDAFAEGANNAAALDQGVSGASAAFSHATGTAHKLAGGTSSMGEAAWYAAVKIGDLTTAWDVLHGRFATADETMLAAKKSIQDVADTFSSGGRQVQGSTVAILENRVALEQAAQKAAAAAEAYLKLTGDTAGAAKIMDDQRVAAEKATGAHGNQAKAVHELADELFKLPAVVPVVIDVVTNYRSPTAGQIAKNLDLADRLDRSHRADGGPVTAGVPYVINERGNETVTFPAGGTVHPANLTPMASGGSMSARPLIIQGDGLGEVFMAWLRNTVGQQGGTLAVLGVRT